MRCCGTAAITRCCCCCRRRAGECWRGCIQHVQRAQRQHDISKRWHGQACQARPQCCQHGGCKLFWHRRRRGCSGTDALRERSPTTCCLRLDTGPWASTILRTSTARRGHSHKDVEEKHLCFTPVFQPSSGTSDPVRATHAQGRPHSSGQAVSLQRPGSCPEDVQMALHHQLPAPPAGATSQGLHMTWQEHVACMGA
jgi:hypothetical protein